MRFDVEWLLRPFAAVRREELPTALLLTLIVFLQLAAYYMLKVAREPLIMVGGGADVKAYSAAGQVALLALAIPLYNSLARRWSATRVVIAVHAFFITNLLLFRALAATRISLGVPFYLWVGVFNVTLIAQFWAFANDVYGKEQGERLFSVLGLGGSAGAVFGAHAAGWLLRTLGPHALMPVAAGVLAVCIGLLLLARRWSRTPGDTVAADEERRPIGGRGLIRLFREDKYLVFIGLLSLLANWVNTLGEYILDRTLLATAKSSVAGGEAALQRYIGSFRARFFGWVNLAGLLLQAFVVSRSIKLLGVPGSLGVLPAAGVGGYLTILFTPSLAVIAVVKAVENSLAYSLQNTARQALFLVTERDAKFKAKTTTDTLLWRSGDLLAAAVVFVGEQLAFGTRSFVGANLALLCAWGGVVVAIWRTHRQRPLPVTA